MGEVLMRILIGPRRNSNNIKNSTCSITFSYVFSVCLMFLFLRHLTVFQNSLLGSEFPVLAGSNAAIKK
jgi:hypothetical protein